MLNELRICVVTECWSGKRRKKVFVAFMWCALESMTHIHSLLSNCRQTLSYFYSSKILRLRVFDSLQISKISRSSQKCCLSLILVQLYKLYVLRCRYSQDCPLQSLLCFRAFVPRWREQRLRTSTRWTWSRVDPWNNARLRRRRRVSGGKYTATENR